MGSFNDAHKSDAGFTLIEIMVSLMIFAMVSLTLLQHLSLSFQSDGDQKDRVFAYMKAQSIISELHALVESSGSSAVDLDVFDEGTARSSVLSIQTNSAGNLIPADHPMSGNYERQGDWVWSRRISVQPFAGIDNRNVRYVTVSVFRSNGIAKFTELAALSAVINSSSTGFPATQVFDVYLLAIENMPGWWVSMENIVPSLEAAVTDLESRNPGLELRTHWVTKASYGRNSGYAPYINDELTPDQPVPYVYYYPGRLPTWNSSIFYNVPSMIRARVLQDGVEAHGYDADLNPHPYALADFYNHGMRLPQERALHELRVSAARQRRIEIEEARAVGAVPPAELDDMSEEPTLRLLLEDMNSSPEKYKHALLINLHGELLAMPSIRNYSDAAKVPAQPGVRVVTHAEEIRTARNTAGGGDDVFLRVYAYSANPERYHSTAVADPVVPEIYVDVMDVDLRGTLLGPIPHYGMVENGSVKAMFGGVTQSDGSREYPPLSMTNSSFPEAKSWFDAGVLDQEMKYRVTFEQLPSGRRFSRISLANTPIRCDEVTGADGSTRGLRANERSRLYGLEYIPSPTRDMNFTRDLSAAGDGPKNTARWRIQIPASVLAEPSRWFTATGDPMASVPDDAIQLTFRTHIADASVTWPQQPGERWPVWNSPENLSESYTWWSAHREDVPWTERSQFLGDPRHMPYRDLLRDDPDYPDGYNWFFASFNSDARTDYPGLQRLYNRWGNQIRQDAPRFLQLLRRGLVETESIYTTLNGYSYYYIGFGNDLNCTANQQPFGGNPTSTQSANNITGYRRYIREREVNSHYWWGMPWLGELYPDHVELDQWRANGNLAAGSSGASVFSRERDSTCFGSSRYRAYGSTTGSAKQRIGGSGCVAFMNNGSSSQHFNHHFSNSTATLVGPGLDLRDNYNFPLPSTTPTNRPFSVNSGGNVPNEFNLPPYSTNRYVATVHNEYYDRGSWTGSGTILLESPDQTNGAFIIISGLSQSTTIGSSFIARYSLLAMLQTYFESGAPALTHRIAMPPRVHIDGPNEMTDLSDPIEVEFTWGVDWKRWDGLKYASSLPDNFSEEESAVEYSLMLSRDNGKSWVQLVNSPTGLQDSTLVATPGERPADPDSLVADALAGQELGVLRTPRATFPHARYLFRVDAFRADQALHYSQHTTSFFISR